MTMASARNAADALHPDFETTSSIVAVRLKLPLIPLYEPVPEPATIGVAPAAVTVPEHVPVLDGKWLNALTTLLSRSAMLTGTSPGPAPA
jgi:hypothetical protein